MVLKRMLSLLFSAGMLIGISASEVLEKPVFEAVFGLGKDSVQRWAYVGKKQEALTLEKNLAHITDGFLILKNLPLVPGHDYKCLFSIRGGEGAEGRCYVEWSKREPGESKTQSQTFSSGWYKTSGDWKALSFRFSLGQEAKSPYLVLGVKPGNAVEFKDVRIEEVTPATDLGCRWELRDHDYTAQGLELIGKKPPAFLHDIPVEPGKRYELSFTAEVLEDSVLPDDGGFFRLRCTVSPDEVSGRMYEADILHGKVNIPQERAQVFYIPPDSAVTKIRFAASARNPGRVRLSRFVLKELPVKASDFWSMKILRPFYRDSFYPGDDVSEIEGEARSAGADALRITFQGKTTEVPVTGNITKFRIPFDLPEGKYPLLCEFLKDGKAEKSLSTVIARWPEAPNIVTVTPDRKIMINGKAFFPIYMKIRGGSDDAAFYFAARSGNNLSMIHLGEEKDTLRKLNTAQKYGVRLFIYPGPPFKAEGLPQFRQTVKKRLTQKVITHPALFGYLLPDEPMLAGMKAEVLQEEYEILKAHDPYHPCWVNLAPRNGVEDLKPYGAASDILGVDIYPIPYPNAHSGLEDKTPTCCGKYALRLNEIGGGKKAIAMFLQGFAWHECTPSDPKAAKKPYPTRAESRFMAFDSLLNGATGYWLWGNYHVQSREFYKLLYDMQREMYRYSGLFSEGKQIDDLETSNLAVRCAVVQYQDRTYYFLLNLTSGPQQAKVSVKGRILDHDNGTLAEDGTVSLSPYEVMVVSEFGLPVPLYDLPARNEELEKQGDPALVSIDELNRMLKAPFYTGAANWIWYPDGQHGLARCFAGKKFTVKAGEKVTLQASADDQFIAYLNGEEVLRGTGHSRMLVADLTSKVRPGENRVIILGMDGGAAPCGILAELRVGEQVYPSDGTWKARAAQKDESVPASLDHAGNAVILAPFGKGPWGKNVRVYKD